MDPDSRQVSLDNLSSRDTETTKTNGGQRKVIALSQNKAGLNQSVQLPPATTNYATRYKLDSLQTPGLLDKPPAHFFVLSQRIADYKKNRSRDNKFNRLIPLS